MACGRCSPNAVGSSCPGATATDIHLTHRVFVYLADRDRVPPSPSLAARAIARSASLHCSALPIHAGRALVWLGGTGPRRPPDRRDPAPGGGDLHRLARLATERSASRERAPRAEASAAAAAERSPRHRPRRYRSIHRPGGEGLRHPERRPGTNDARDRCRKRHVTLTKPRIISLLLLTCVATMFVADPGGPALSTILCCPVDTRPGVPGPSTTT
jgi:hypothetical protein